MVHHISQNARHRSPKITRVTRPAMTTVADMGLPDPPTSPPSLGVPAPRLAPPRTRRRVVGGARVSTLLDRARDHRLTLLEAPAGFGKTTHLASWFRAQHANAEGVVAWLSVSDLDNDPATFLGSIIAALRNSGAHALGRPEAALQVVGTDLEQVTTWLANDLSAAGAGSALLAVDDLHLIDDPRCISLLNQLIDETPAGMRYVIASRSQPRLALGRRRAAGEFLHIKSADLRLTPEETVAYIAATEGREIGDDEGAALWARTEGWPAAIQLTAIWLRHGEDPSRLLHSASGQQRGLVDYLGEQVMSSLDEDTACFLLRTSVLGRFCADLCEALTGRPGAQATIELAEQANLFIIPLDDRREWYRYHPLFGEFLRDHLRRRRPDLAVEMHRRASAWHARRGTTDEAFRHAVLAGERATAVGMLTTKWVSLFRLGRQGMVHRWISLLSRTSGEIAPEIADIAGLALAYEGAPAHEVEAWADLAARTRAQGAAPARDHRDETGSYGTNAEVLSAAFLYRDIHAATERMQSVLAGDDPTTVWWIPGHAALAYLHHLAGNEERALEVIGIALSRPEAKQRPVGYITAFATKALVHASLGDFVAGRRAAAQAISHAEGLGLHKTPAAGLAYTGLAQNLIGLEATSDGLEAARRGYAALQARTPRAMEIAALLTLGRAQRLSGDVVGAHDSADAAEDLLREFTDAGRLTRDLDGLRGMLVASRRRRSTSASGELTETEVIVLRHLTGGLSVRETADALGLSPNTIKTHCSHAYRKLGVSSRTEARAALRARGVV